MVIVYNSRSSLSLSLSFLQLLNIQRLNVSVIDDVHPCLHYQPVSSANSYSYCYSLFLLKVSTGGSVAFGRGALEQNTTGTE